MTIKEIEYRSGLPRANVRYYESEGLIHPTRAANGYRDYSQDDLDTLMKIKLLRELGCSLEEIAALQREETSLSAVLTLRLETLEEDSAALERSKALCAQLRAEGITYATLEPQRYLSQPPAPPWDPAQDAVPRYPWRRLFARGLDLYLCGRLFQLLRVLITKESNLNRGSGDAWLVALASAVLLLFLEPLCLRFFRATPGKWVFRLRLSRDDGRPLGYLEGLGRTAQALLLGCGLELPLVGIVTRALAFRRDRQGWQQPWERDDQLYADTAPDKDFPVLRGVLLYAAAFGLTLLPLIGGELLASRLPYPHPDTVAQFAANYNHTLDYTSAGQRVSPTSYLTPEGTFAPAPEDGTIVFGLSEEFPDFTYSLGSDGALTRVALDLDASTDFVLNYPGDRLALALLAIEGDRAIFLDRTDPLCLRCNALLRGDGEALSSLPDGLWHASLDYAVTGGVFYSDSGLFVPYPGPVQWVTLDFRLQRVD